MADEFDDAERLRRLLGAYAPDEEQWFPSEGEPPYEQQGPPEPDAGGATDPQVYGRPAPEPEPGFESGGGEFQEPPAAAPPQFDPRAEVARMTAPPPPPIRVYAHTPGGLQEISQVEGSQGQPVGSAQAAQMLGSAGQALLAREQAIRSDPQMSPADKSRQLGHIHEIAGKLVEQSLIHGHGAPAQAMEGQFSNPQQQQLTRLDAAEDQANQNLVSKEWDVGMHHDVMEQIAEQRQAIKAKMVPKGPTMQETFDGHVALGPHGEVMTPVIDKEGHVHDWKRHKTSAETHADELIKMGFSPLQAQQLSTAPELKKMGKLTPEDEARLNAMKPQYGHLVKGSKADEGLGLPEKDWVAEKLKIVKSIDDRIHEGQKEKAAHSGFQPDLTPDMRDQAIDAEMEKFGLGVQGYPKTYDWYAKHHRPGGFFNRTPAPGQGPPPGAAPPPQPGVRQQLGDISNQAFNARDDNAFRATAELLEIQKKYPAGLPMIRDPAERAAVIERLKAIKRYYPTLNIPEK